MNFKKCRFVLGAILIMVMVFGVTVHAAPKLMVKVEEQSITPKPDQALIVFMRSSFAGKVISASLFDVSGDDTKFIGIMYNGTKVSYDITPGEHTFMVVSESADFMKATVSTGKTYYALVTPRMGAMKARFSFRPLRLSDLSSADFSKWDSNTYFVENTSGSEEWAKKNSPDIEAKRARYWSIWSEKSSVDLEEQTIKAEDGI